MTESQSANTDTTVFAELAWPTHTHTHTQSGRLYVAQMLPLSADVKLQTLHCTCSICTFEIKQMLELD